MATKLAAIYNTEIEALGKRASAFKQNPKLVSKRVDGELIALDCFSGAGGFSTGLLRAARDAGFHVKHTLINHWSVALDNARENLGDVTVINSGIQEVLPLEAIPGGYVDIMLASPECFAAGTLILTTDGLIPIEIIQPGMMALTHKGRYRRVVATRQTNAPETLIVRGHGHPGLETTANHPFFARERSRKWNNTNRSYDRIMSDPKWTEASALTSESYWAVPTSYPELEIPEVPGRGMNFDEDFFWLVGRYLGDGSLCNKADGDEVTICCGKHEADELDVILTRYAPPASQKRAGKGFLRFRRRDVRTATLFEAGHTGLVAWLEAQFGRRAENKTIPAWALGMAESFRQSLLDGYLSADGSKTIRNEVSGNSVSKKLALGLRLIAESLGHHVSMLAVESKGVTIEGRTFETRLQHKFCYYEPLHPDHTQCVDGDIHRWHPIREVTTGKTNVAVYNLQVEEDESYVADGIVVHNCVMFSSARGARPISDQRRSTAGEILRFLEELYVETLVLENVSELRQWGPIDPITHRPIPEKKGEYFAAFIKAIKRLGYDVAFQDVIAADHGDPTTRKRFFMVAQKNRRASFPIPKFSKNASVPGTSPWVPARRIIDFDVKGLSIFARSVPHVVKTLRRIGIGFSDQRSKTPLADAYVESVERFKRVTEMYYAQLAALPTAKALKRKLTKIEAMEVKQVKLAAQHQHRLLVEEIFRTPVATLTWNDILLHESVQPTLEGDHRLTLGTLNVVDPVITKLFGTANTTDVNEPLSTIKAGGTTFGLAQPVPDRITQPDTFLVTVNHGASTDTGARHASIDEPLQTITCRGSHGVVKPFCLRANASDTSAWDDSVTSLDVPLRTVTTKNNLSLIVPDVTILPQHTYNNDTTASPDQPLPTITTISRHGLVQPTATAVEAFIAPNYGPTANGTRDRRPRSIDQPLPTQTTTSTLAVVQPLAATVEPFISSYYGPTGPNSDKDRRPRSIDEPLATQTTQNTFALVTPEASAVAIPEMFITPNFGERPTQKPRTHTLDEPLPTATSHGAGMLVAPGFNVEPIVVNLKGQSTATSVDVPLPTQTAHAPHFYLADPVLVSRHIGFENKESPNPNLDEPMVTATCRGAGYIAQPAIKDADPVLVSQHSGFDNANPSLDAPLVTATTRGAGYIAQPEIDQTILDRAAISVTAGKPYIIVDGQLMELDITYRMLAASELSKAMSFTSGTDEYKFKDSSSQSERVKMIGNAVACLTAKAIIAHALAYRFKSGEVVVPNLIEMVA